MIENFLRRPQTVAEACADVVRGLGALSVIITAVWFDLTDAGVLALALPGLLIPRFLGVRAWVDITFGATLLVAAWSNVFDLYARIVGWDLIVHFACTAALAMVAYLLLRRTETIAVPDPRSAVLATVLITTMLGLALSAFWEMIEWLGYTYISDEIFVGYDDTIADMAVGGLGAACAGIAVAFAPLLRSAAVGPAP
ncbi:DUF2238 domain-containing protein [Microbacterium sp. A94]|uniref:DUF2238 domain-containing protein n=1 Tax=Microbacterium sp. A94 TaxID=3450717 RepID=UPI003F436CA7